MSSSVRAWPAVVPRGAARGPSASDLPNREREREREPCVHRTKLAGIDVNDIVTASYFVPSNVRDAEREREREREGESVRLPPPKLPPCEQPADDCVSVDDDNISDSTDASCITDLSWETVSDTGSKTAKAGKKKKKKKSGAARKKRRKERIDRPTAPLEAESAGNVSSDSNPRKEACLDILSSLARRGDLPTLADLGYVYHADLDVLGVLPGSDSSGLGRLNSMVSDTQFADWQAAAAATAAEKAAVAAALVAGMAVELAAAKLAANGKLLAGGLTRRRRGRRGVGSGRRRRRREGKERRRHRQDLLRWALMQEGWQRDEMRWQQRQEAKWQRQVTRPRLRRRRTTRTTRRRAVAAARTTRRTRQRMTDSANSDDYRRRRDGGGAPASLCGQRVRVAGCWWGRGPRYRLGGGGKRGWVT